MNRSASARLCATLLVTNPSLSVNLGSHCSDYYPASRSEVKPRTEVGFIGKPTGVYVCVWCGVGVVFINLLCQSGSSKKQMSDGIRCAAGLLGKVLWSIKRAGSRIQWEEPSVLMQV